MKETIISDDTSEIRYRDGIRQVKHSAEIESAEPPEKMEVKEGGVYLITGGTRSSCNEVNSPFFYFHLFGGLGTFNFCRVFHLPDSISVSDF